MATTAHEVALGVSVDSQAAEASLSRLSNSLISLGATFNGTVLSQIRQFNSAVSSLIPSVGRLGASLNGLSAPLSTLSTVAGTASTALSSLNVAPMIGQLSRFNVAMTGLVGSVSGLGTAAIRLVTPLSTLSTALAALSASSAGLNITNLGTQLQSFASAINAVDATKLARQIGVLAVGLDRGSASIAAYPPMLTSMARAFQRMGAVNIGNIFSQQIVGITGLNTALTTALGPVQNYATALRTIASASRGLAATSSSIGALAAQAAGIQLLSNAITLNIVNLQRYAAAMSTVATATSAIARSSASTSRLVTSISAMAAAAPTVAGAFVAMNAAVAPFVASLRTAASSAQRLYTRLVQLATISGSLSTAIGSSRSSMGLFAGILGVAAGSITSQIGLLARLASSYSSAGTAARSTGSAVSSSNSAFSKGASVVSALVREISLVAGAYIGAQAIQEFGKKIIKTGADFDNAMGMVKAVSRNTSDYSTAAFMAMEREAFRMGRTTTYSATNAAEALKELTQGGLTTQQAIQALGDTMTLAETENMSMADASRTVTSMMAQFQASASDLTSFVDKLAKTSAVSKTSIDQLRVAMAYVGTAARSANQPFAEVVSAVGALSTAGVESSQAGTTLRDMLTDLTDTTSYASRKLRSLGLDMDQVNPRTHKLSEIIGTLKARGIDAADAMGIFGVRGGLAAGSLITVYKQYMDVLNAVQNKSEGTAAIMQQDVTNNLLKDFDKLAASWDYLVNRIFKSGFGDLMRNLVQQAREFTIQISDMVDTFKNASTFGDLGELVSTGLKIGFGTAINYLAGGVLAGVRAAASFMVGSLKVFSNINFWSGLLDIVKVLGNGLSAVFKLAISELIQGNTEFSTSLIQTVLYAGDLFVHKMKEAAGVMSGIASPSYQKARLEAGDADRKLMAAQSGSAAFEVRNAAISAKISGSDENMANLERASKAYNAYIEPFIKAQDQALKKLEQESQRAGIVGSYSGSFKDFAGKAREIVGTAPGDLQSSAKEDIDKAKQAMPGAIAAVADVLTKGLAGPAMDAASSFKPFELVSQSSIDADKARVESLLKQNAPTIPSAPTKTFEPVTTGKVSQGVGPITLDSKGSASKSMNVGSAKEMGSGIWQGMMGGETVKVFDPLEKATTENTAAINGLTGAITGTATASRTGNMVNVTGGITESQRQTDLATWAATGKVPERLKNAMDAVNLSQAQATNQANKITDREALIASQKASTANIGNITSSFGLKMELANPIASALQSGIAVAFDREGRAVQQSGLPLGLPANQLFGKTSAPGQISSQDLFGIIGQLRLGAGIGAGEASRLSTPQTLITPAIDKMQTIRPMDFDLKQQLLNVPTSSSPLSGPGVIGNTPTVAAAEDRYGAQQVAGLSDIKATLNAINSSIKSNNKADSTKLVITIV
jgi:TP901 family phage tail tape measure protein